MEYGGIVCGGIGRKMSQMWVRASKSLVCSVAGTSLMVHNRKCSALTMWSSGVTAG